MCDIVPSEVDILSSSKEVCKVLEEWTSDDESIDMDIMEVDEQIGSNFLCDDLFGDVTCSTTSQPNLNLPASDTFTEIFLSSDIVEKGSVICFLLRHFGKSTLLSLFDI